MPMLVVAVACGGGGDEPSPSPAEPPQVIAEPTGAGRLESATQLNRISAAEIGAELQAPGSRSPPLAPRYDVVNHRLTYRTTDARGSEIVASALVSVPVKPAGAKSPVLSYQHATIVKDAEAPSNHATADEIVVVLASLGYIVVAADYVGYGASQGAPHPYLLAAPSAAAVVDLLTAASTWRSRNRIADNGQLFLAGYSEGGYTTLAAHRALQAAGRAPLSGLAVVVAGAGPYDVGVVLDELLRRVSAENPTLGLLVSPIVLRHLSASVRREVRELLRKRLLDDDADVAFDLTLLDLYLADDRAEIARLSDVIDWAPAAPLRLFHGRDDQTVPYVSSTQALQKMRARGAGDVSLTDCAAAPSSHIGCVPSFVAFMLGEFALRARDL
jgi:pimeloyl-ACP methyl ester carboxylesterase